MTGEELSAQILSVIASAPAWVRHDLQAADAMIRLRAEETLAATIGARLIDNALDLPRARDAA
jgi:hypothetical protein